MNHSLAIFLQFLRRDAYTYWQRCYDYALNYTIIYPILTSIVFGYIQPAVYFSTHDSAYKGTTVFIGQILIVVLVLAFSFMINLLFDFEYVRFIDYQITLLNPRLIIIERIIFRALLIFVLSAPFFPISKIILGNLFITTNTSWPLLFGMLFLSALCCCSYMQCMVCIIPNTRGIRRFWMRINFILITLGGLFMPWYIVAQFSPVLGMLVLANPLIYITEGIRQAILHDPHFLSLPVCASALVLFSCLFTAMACYFFKRRTDHI